MFRAAKMLSACVWHLLIVTSTVGLGALVQAQSSTLLASELEPARTTIRARTEQLIDVDTRLLRHLFSDYVPTKPRCVRKVRNATIIPGIVLKLHLFQVLDVDVVKQTVVLNVDFNMYWRDCRLIWKPEEFENVTNVQVPNRMYETWIPDISWIEQVDTLIDWHENSAVVAHSNGVLQLATQFQLKFSCSFNLYWYPFDVHSCKVSFNSWLHRYEDLNISFKAGKEDNSQYFIENDQWHLVHTEFGWHLHEFDEDQYAVAVYYIQFSRRPLFHVFNLIIPCTMIMLVCSTVFCIPADSEEKISLALTIQLTLVVFILMMFDKLPDSADSIPLLSKYFAACMIIVSIACVCTVCVVNIHWRSECHHHVPIPRYVHAIFTEYLAPILLPSRIAMLKMQTASLQPSTGPDGVALDENAFHMSHSHSQQHRRSISFVTASTNNNDTNKATPSSSEPPNAVATTADSLPFKCSLFNIAVPDARKDKILLDWSTEWALIAEVVDRVLFIIFLFAEGVMTIVFLAAGYTNEVCYESNTC